jgi:uncharacterized protein
MRPLPAWGGRRLDDRRHHEAGTFCWAGLATSDPAAATSFYTELFGWTAEELRAGDASSFTMLRSGGDDVAVLYRQQPQARAVGVAPHWSCFISVENAGATSIRAGELGGAAVFREPFDVLDAGRVAAIRDPTGAIVSVWQPLAVTGATLVNAVGAVCWNELATTDVQRAKSFFAQLLGWDYEIDASGYTTINCGGSTIGGIRRLTDQETGVAPTWLPFFMVESVEEAARDADLIGGSSFTPAVGTSDGRSTLIADPQGALFGISEA